MFECEVVIILFNINKMANISYAIPEIATARAWIPDFLRSNNQAVRGDIQDNVLALYLLRHAKVVIPVSLEDIADLPTDFLRALAEMNGLPDQGRFGNILVAMRLLHAVNLVTAEDQKYVTHQLFNYLYQAPDEYINEIMLFNGLRAPGPMSRLNQIRSLVDGQLHYPSPVSVLPSEILGQLTYYLPTRDVQNLMTAMTYQPQIATDIAKAGLYPLQQRVMWEELGLENVARAGDVAGVKYLIHVLDQSLPIDKLLQHAIWGFSEKELKKNQLIRQYYPHKQSHEFNQELLNWLNEQGYIEEYRAYLRQINEEDHDDIEHIVNSITFLNLETVKYLLEVIDQDHILLRDLSTETALESIISIVIQKHLRPLSDYLLTTPVREPLLNKLLNRIGWYLPDSIDSRNVYSLDNIKYLIELYLQHQTLEDLLDMIGNVDNLLIEILANLGQEAFEDMLRYFPNYRFSNDFLYRYIVKATTFPNNKKIAAIRYLVEQRQLPLSQSLNDVIQRRITNIYQYMTKETVNRDLKYTQVVVNYLHQHFPHVQPLIQLPVTN